MNEDKLRKLINIAASTLAEVGEIPEGILYAGLMQADVSFADYGRIKAVLVSLGLATVEPGPVLRATAKLLEVQRLAMSKTTVMH